MALFPFSPFPLFPVMKLKSLFLPRLHQLALAQASPIADIAQRLRRVPVFAVFVLARIAGVFLEHRYADGMQGEPLARHFLGQRLELIAAPRSPRIARRFSRRA